EERRTAIAKREHDLEHYLKQHENEWCGAKTQHPSSTYILGNGAIGLERIADEMRARGRKVEYHNTGMLFPDLRADRMPFFIDPVHLSDRGSDVLGEFYAQRILATMEADR